MGKTRLMLHTAMLLALAVSAMGCAQTSTVTAPPPEPPRIPEMPPQARQPAMPSECSQTCSKSLIGWRASMRKRLTLPMPPASPASAQQTR